MIVSIVFASALFASGAPQATLASVPCDRLAEALAAYHEGSLEFEAMAIGFGGSPDSKVADFGKKLSPVFAYMKKRNLRAKKSARQETALYQSNGIAMLDEFSRRCGK
ncbi:MAG: hypothetical protein EOP60_01745 [Sphingomonadales bacterium]|nr:MAG: hypothetical protein EOP60_01745 [Sphingomonadales bacterium]